MGLDYFSYKQDLFSYILMIVKNPPKYRQKIISVTILGDYSNN